MKIPEDDSTLTQARITGWGSLADGFDRQQPWVIRLHRQMLLWLDGEEVEFVEYGWDQDPAVQRSTLSAYEARSVWVNVLTSRYLLRVTLSKPADTAVSGRIESWEMVDRSSLRKMEVISPLSTDTDWRLRLRVEFDGVTGPFDIPSSANYGIPGDDHRPLFRGLRENLFEPTRTA